jgi:hypothetical protein
MTAVLRYSCDGHRHGQPCRGALPTHTDDWQTAETEAGRNGWRGTHLNGTWLDLCPSPGHDEDHDQ